MTGCDYRYRIMLTELKSGKVLSYSHFDDLNEMCKELGFNLICKNEDLVLTDIYCE